MKTYEAHIYRTGGSVRWPYVVEAEIDGTEGRTGRRTLIAGNGESPEDALRDVTPLIEQQYGPCQPRRIIFAAP